MTTNKQGVILPLYSALVRSHLESLSGLVFPGGMNIVWKGQRRRMKELKLLTYEERLRWLGQFSLEKRRLRKDLISVHKYFQRGCKDRTRLFSVMPSERVRGNEHKLKQDILSGMSLNSFFLRVTVHWHGLSREPVESPTLKIVKSSLDMVLTAQFQVLE